ncbi:MAG: DUF523 domain-containing protein [Ruegeria pomeroyi]|uniref:DUF523 domain-containing protein n=1 Tax=Ruegeria pomeroyi TaxID=89184 RepID=A0A850LK42_9RHOB|nr:DUF523 domain-containing protein [Ruegeria pomeroyi]NVL02687.1 DUF523 domain-containing protein [Ruegeria pomeroyi]HCE72123.1 DUF523 domain-containing protein [Ruegeria sp.]
MSKVLVSACLLGQPLHYNGQALSLEGGLIPRWRARGIIVPLCPQIAAGFATPRPPAKIVPGFDGADGIDGHGGLSRASA